MLINPRIKSFAYLKKNNSTLSKLQLIKYLVICYLTALKNRTLDILEGYEIIFSLSSIQINNSRIQINLIYYILNNLDDLELKYSSQLAKPNHSVANLATQPLSTPNLSVSVSDPDLDPNTDTKLYTDLKPNTDKSIYTGTGINIDNSDVLNKLFNNKGLNNLTLLLEKLTNQRVQINLTRIYYPYIDATIFSKWILIQLKIINFKKLIKLILKNLKTADFTKYLKLKPIVSKYQYLKIQIPTIYVGFRIDLNGRLTLERSKPRITRKYFKYGNLRNAPDIIYNTGSAESINELGSHSIKVVLSSQKF